MPSVDDVEFNGDLVAVDGVRGHLEGIQEKVGALRSTKDRSDIIMHDYIREAL
jgi:hypothetical protein